MTEQKPYAKRQAVALAVAAALLAASGAAAADQVNYDRITESIDSPTTDAVVTYTDQTADTFVTQPPVMPEDRDAQATGMTLTLNSLTVTNETTEGYSTSGSRNGLGITTNGGPPPGKIRQRAAYIWLSQVTCPLPRGGTPFRYRITTISTAQSAAI